ncbi:MAG TPA: hypothetical protein PLV92_28180, partial [Pirellulaceae bacterium]|nr:hypothetical protein [Pirellulaceae bacterium]
PRPATASVAAAPEPKVERPATAKSIASPRPATASVAAAPAPRVSTPAPAQQFAKANVSAPPTATFAASTSPVATLPVPAGWQPPHAQQPRVASEPSAHRSISAPARTPALTAQVAPALPPKIEMSSEASRAGESIAANQLQTLPTSPLVSTGARRAVVDSAVVRATPVSANVSSPKSASFARYQGEVAPTPAAPKPMPEAAGARQPEPLPSVHEADSGYTAIPWGDWLAGEGEYCEDCDECCRDRCGIVEQRQNIRSAARQMGQHQPYQVWPWTYYYFRAYDYRQIHELQHQAEQWGGNPRQPQARDLFEKLYEELAPKLDSPEPFVEGPKPEAK